jgi:hypothetical protein
MAQNPMRDPITAEHDRHGVEWFEEAGAKHQRIVLDLPGRPFVPYSRGTHFDGPITRVLRSRVRRLLRSTIQLRSD